MKQRVPTDPTPTTLSATSTSLYLESSTETSLRSERRYEVKLARTLRPGRGR